MSDREIEAAVLTKAALNLKRCQANWNERNYDKLDKALKFNQSVWSVFQSELSKEDSPVPIEIRQDVLNLSLYVDKRTFEILAYPEPGKLNILININMNIAAGLRRIPAVINED